MLQKDRKRIFVRGLGLLEIRELEPSLETSKSDAGYLNDTILTKLSEMLDVTDENGNLIDSKEQNVKVTIETNLHQSGIDEINLLNNAAAKKYALCYSGMAQSDKFQFYSFEKAGIKPGITKKFAAGQQLLQLSASAFDRSDDAGYTIPLFYLYEAEGRMHVRDINLWLDARLGYNSASAYLLDISGFGRHATLNSDYATIWQAGTTPNRFWRFDGSNDFADLGDVCDIGTNSFILEGWLTIKGANASLQEVLSKKATSSTTSDAGFWLERDASNKLKLYLSDGTHADTLTSTATVLISTRVHFMFVFNRTGNSYIYLNGALDTTDDLSAITDSIGNAVSLYLARGGSGYGQIDIDALRIHLKSSVWTNHATIALNHYNSEKAHYGIS
jgi:hypothetical protein